MHASKGAGSDSTFSAVSTAPGGLAPVAIAAGASVVEPQTQSTTTAVAPASCGTWSIYNKT
jgi:hypothetical protein